MNTDSVTDKSRGAKRKAKTRADILKAARKVFAQRGYHDAGILDITAEANVGVGTFYLHFKDKDDVFNTVIDEVLCALEEKVVSDIREKKATSLPIVIRAIFLNAYENRDLYRVALNRDSNVKRYLSVEETMTQGIKRVLALIGNQGVAGTQDTYLLARLTTGMIAQGIIWWFQSEKPGPDEMANLVIHLLEHGLPGELFQDHTIELSATANDPA